MRRNTSTGLCLRASVPMVSASARMRSVIAIQRASRRTDLMSLPADAGHPQAQPLDPGVGARALSDDAPRAEHRDAVRQGHDLVEVGGDQKHGRAPRPWPGESYRELSARRPGPRPASDARRRAERGAWTISRPTSSFCWLPPENAPAGWSASGGGRRNP